MEDRQIGFRRNAAVPSTPSFLLQPGDDRNSSQSTIAVIQWASCFPHHLCVGPPEFATAAKRMHNIDGPRGISGIEPKRLERMHRTQLGLVELNKYQTDAWPEISATKLEAAKRQLDAGIRMLFAREDPLAVHTLAFAAYGLLVDLSLAAGRTETLKRLEADAKLRGGKKFWRELKKLANFLKHADHDAHLTLSGVPEEINEGILLVDCFLLRELDQLSSPESQALWLWHHALFFVNIDGAPEEYWGWMDEIQTELHAETRDEKIEIGARLLDRLKSCPSGSYRMDPDQIFLPWRLFIR